MVVSRFPLCAFSHMLLTDSIPNMSLRRNADIAKKPVHETLDLVSQWDCTESSETARAGQPAGAKAALGGGGPGVSRVRSLIRTPLTSALIRAAAKVVFGRARDS
jgi:hypothetical protein